MMMPALQVVNLVVRQARFTLGALNTFFDPMFGFGHSSKLRQFCFTACIGQVVIRLDHFSIITVSIADYDQHFSMAFSPLVGTR